MEISVLAIDTAKEVFELSGVNRYGREVYRKRVRRNRLLSEIEKLPGCKIVLEASGGAHYWGRELSKLGHNVELIAPQFVKPFVRGNKTDRSDALAIGTAAREPGMRFVAVKSIDQQELQFLHRVRSRNIKQRTAVSNEVRGFLREYGITMPRGLSRIRQLPEVLEANKEKISPMSHAMFQELHEEFLQLDAKVKQYDKLLKNISQTHPVAKKLLQIRGIGPVIATALISSVGNAQEYKNGRGFSAWLGLVPRQRASGDVRRLGSITKRGDTYLRQLIIHGARAVVRAAAKKTDEFSVWINTLRERKGFNKTVVAVANKNARVAWVLLATDQPYRPWFAAAQ